MLTVSSNLNSVRNLTLAAFALLLAIPALSFAQTSTVCGPAVKQEVARSLQAVENATDQEKAATYDQIYAKYASCGTADALAVQPAFISAARECGAAVSNLGSLFYEEMSCAGYDPQRRQFAAPVKIKQIFGFGGTPLPGSREYVLHCVQAPSGAFLPVALDSVHLSDAIAGSAPTWQFAVIANANQNLQLIQPMNGATRVAKSILSWGLPPTGCNYTPIWGNALTYRIRLDQ